MRREGYGVGIPGNCCTHGTGVAGAFASHPRTRVVAGYEPDSRWGPELAAAMKLELLPSYEDFADHSAVTILRITTDPCEKTDMVELACSVAKPVCLNKPVCESKSSWRRIGRSQRMVKS